jgi:hypothetical protein
MFLLHYSVPVPTPLQACCLPSWTSPAAFLSLQPSRSATTRLVHLPQAFRSAPETYPWSPPPSPSGAVIVTADFTVPSPIDIEVVSSSIGPVDTQLLSQGINDIVKTIVLPWLNYKGQHQVTSLSLDLFFVWFL